MIWVQFPRVQGHLAEEQRTILPPPRASKDRWLTMKIVKFLVIGSLFFAAVIPFTGARAFGQSTKALLLFGGEDHKKFLGCLNCSSLNSSSVCNELGKYGSSLQSDSIWNSLGTFGSSLSRYSPWNSLSSSAPIIVDADGKSYGYFSTNSLHHDRTRISWLVAILDYEDEKDDLDKTRDKMCGD
jgi:hypothetical protein